MRVKCAIYFVWNYFAQHTTYFDYSAPHTNRQICL